MLNSYYDVHVHAWYMSYFHLLIFHDQSLSLKLNAVIAMNTAVNRVRCKNMYYVCTHTVY